ncbi:putative fatty acyl-CoA reductase CG5065 isoform X2 [Frieseomelitta varia]|uniref:putative fatty acyl-CoA reductase CG5065 isoform X2 n=1 Tax=Frieseomelitta varia TaxID=561572 RepID=UPI001CB6A065|nr:putative fatty acyl-CoA reductase CG5065 isoform X2 [Frieseomelitta varia]
MDRMNIKVNENNVNVKPSKANSIEAFYDNTAIFVTGATGFVGQGILEKLMRICPGIAAIYILLRPKKEQTIKQRFKKLIDDPIYDNVRVKHPSILSRIHPVEGDVSLPDLGLSSADRTTLIKNVNIVFHVAATVRFNEPLNVAVNTNTKGTARIMELCKELKHLISVVYISTAYSNANILEIEEKVYTTSFKPSTVINMCETGDQKSIDLLEDEILRIYPNMYTFSKNLAEQVISNNADSLPVAIVRPSVIGASLKEPCPGWVNNIFGLTSIFMLVGNGIIRAMLVKRSKRLNLVPVDYVVDMIICAAWHVTLYRNNEVKVYNSTSNAHPVRWNQMRDILVQCSRETPMNNIMWYPFCILVPNQYGYNVLDIFLHILPAFFMDIFLKLSGRKPMIMKTSKFFNQVVRSVKFFGQHEWTFHQDNVTDMIQKVKLLKDRDIVKLDLWDMDWKKYMTTYVMGIEKFILKEDSKSIDAAQKRLLLYIVKFNILNKFC